MWFSTNTQGSKSSYDFCQADIAVCPFGWLVKSPETRCQVTKKLIFCYTSLHHAARQIAHQLFMFVQLRTNSSD